MRDRVKATPRFFRYGHSGMAPPGRAAKVRLAISEHAFYREPLGIAAGELPQIEDIDRRSFSIPHSAALADADIAHAIEAMRRIALTHAAF